MCTGSIPPDQGLGDRSVAMAGSNMEGRVALFVLNIYPGTCAQADMTQRGHKVH